MCVCVVCVWEREREEGEAERKLTMHVICMPLTQGKQGTRSFVQAGFQGALLGMDMCVSLI